MLEQKYCKSGFSIFSLLGRTLYFWQKWFRHNLFSGCNLKFVYCQNYSVSTNNYGKSISVKRLSEIMIELQNKKAHNINLVSPTHFVPNIIKAIKMAKENGLVIPIIYNSNAYENIETTKSLSGLIAVYLPDLKYYSDKYEIKYSNAKNYFKCAIKAIDEMYRQVGEIKFNKNGVIVSEMIVRHLIIPGLIGDSKKIL